jgi:hypothetical protein
MKKKKRKTFFSPRDGRRKKWNKRLERFTWRTKIIYCHLNAGTIIPPPSSLKFVCLFFLSYFPLFILIFWLLLTQNLRPIRVRLHGNNSFFYF